MPKQLTFLSLAEKVLRDENRPLSPSEIWRVAQSKGYDRQLDSDGKTPAATLYSAIFSNTRDNPDTVFYKLGERPARYFLKELERQKKPSELKTATEASDSVPPLYDYTEADLHPFVTYYAQIYFRAYTKTIRHNSSKKKEFGEWVHPDIIGVYYSVEDWKPEVLDLSAATGNTALKLYSFELKKSLSFSNLREAFFQAVSNSSWANDGYLIAADISDDEDFLLELRRLSAGFGIGVIRIAVDDPDSSKVLFPARENEAIEWDTLNKLTMNVGVKDLLVRIKNDLQSKEIRKEMYDKILTTQELAKLIKKKSS